MARKLTLPPGLSKRNGGWPLSWGGGGMARVNGADRAQESLGHLARTPQGAMWADGLYGTQYHLLLTQGVGNDGVSSPQFDAANAEFQGVAASYVPDVKLIGIEPEIDDKTVVLQIGWTFKGEVQVSSGRGADRVRVTPVKI